MNDLTVAEPIAPDAIRSRILTIRGVQVMLAPDLAMLYNVPTKRLNEQVKRNIERFPKRFMFHLSHFSATFPSWRNPSLDYKAQKHAVNIRHGETQHHCGAG